MSLSKYVDHHITAAEATLIFIQWNVKISAFIFKHVELSFLSFHQTNAEMWIAKRQIDFHCLGCETNVEPLLEGI